MKNKFLILTLIVAAGALSWVQSDNGKAGYTASPGESSCNASGCHTGNTINAAGGSITITAPTMPGWQYNSGPGLSY
ncbi:MAG: hypothetical protein IPP71_18225 [Bacteroidetes bacterium]|nr:hypothetical protein [Bacteroidota bacterium]